MNSASTRGKEHKYRLVDVVGGIDLGLEEKWEGCRQDWERLSLLSRLQVSKMTIQAWVRGVSIQV